MSEHYFTYKGTDIRKLGLMYVPQASDVYPHKLGSYSLSEETFAGHDGGYFYGTTLLPKAFTLRCVFIETDVDSGIMAKVYALFKRGTSGKLVFSNRTWCYYNATVVGVDISNLINCLNGYITISMKAYYPFAIGTKHYLSSTTNTALLNNTGMISEVINNSGTLINFSNGTTSGITYIYNCGTLKSPTLLQFNGSATSQARITNKTNGTYCLVEPYVALKTVQNLMIDSMNGKVYIDDLTTGEATMSYVNHSSGFLYLLPGGPVKRNKIISIKQFANANEMTTYLNSIYKCDTNSGSIVYAANIVSDTNSNLNKKIYRLTLEDYRYDVNYKIYDNYIYYYSVLYYSTLNKSLYILLADDYFDALYKLSKTKNTTMNYLDSDGTTDHRNVILFSLEYDSDNDPCDDIDAHATSMCEDIRNEQNAWLCYNANAASNYYATSSAALLVFDDTDEGKYIYNNTGSLTSTAKMAKIDTVISSHLVKCDATNISEFTNTSSCIITLNLLYITKASSDTIDVIINFNPIYS